MKDSTGVVVLSTFSDEKSAQELSRKMLKAKLCACVNIVKVESMYFWRGKMEDQDEYLVLFKTTGAASQKLRKALAEQHPYEVPEIVELKMSSVSKPYLSWLATETSADRISKNRHYAAKRRNSQSNVR